METNYLYHNFQVMDFQTVTLWSMWQPEDGNNIVLWKGGIISHHYMVSEPKRPQFASLLWKSQISHLYHYMVTYGFYFISYLILSNKWLKFMPSMFRPHLGLAIPCIWGFTQSFQVNSNCTKKSHNWSLPTCTSRLTTNLQHMTIISHTEGNTILHNR